MGVVTEVAIQAAPENVKEVVLDVLSAMVALDVMDVLVVVKAIVIHNVKQNVILNVKHNAMAIVKVFVLEERLD